MTSLWKKGNPNYQANLRIFHGGKFETKKCRTEYVGGGVYLKINMDDICLSNLEGLVKSALKFDDIGQIWFRRPGLSLSLGRKRIDSDYDIECLLSTKDMNGFVNLYTVHDDSTTLSTQPDTPLFITRPSVNANPFPQTSNPPFKPVRPQKLPCIRTKNASFQQTTSPSKQQIAANLDVIEKRVVYQTEGTDGPATVEVQTVDEGVIQQTEGEAVRSQTDFVPSDEEFYDDDLFAENVDGDAENDDLRLFSSSTIEGDTHVLDEELGDTIEGDTHILDLRLFSSEDDNEVEDAQILSDEEELGDTHILDANYPTFNPELDFKKPVNLSFGLKFPNRQIFRKAVRHHAIENGYDYYILHNGKDRVDVYCRYRFNCEWVKGRAKLRACTCDNPNKCRYKVNATVVEGEDTFQIMGLRLNHSCGWNDFNKKCSSAYLAEKYLDYWRLDNTTKIEKFQNQVFADLGVEIGYHKAYYAKEKALKLIHGVAAEEYKRVFDYAFTIPKYNNGSSVFVKLINIERPPPIFQRMYMCLEACKRGFMNGVRPILGVDGCHLKGPYPGQLLTAVGKDGNGNIFPVAWAIVEVENTDSWCWFLELLATDLEEVIGNLTFMSDRQKGFVEAFRRVVPNCDIRFCARHIWTNFKQAYPGEEIRQCFWSAARAYVEADFKNEMEKMRQLSEGAARYLQAIPTKHWCRHAFSTRSKSAMLLNNCCESFNNAIKKCREMPALSMMEWLRRYNMKRMFNKKEGIKNLKGNIMPAIQKQIDKAAKRSRNCKYLQASSTKFEVIDGDDRFTVELQEKTCTCFKWDLTGVPCAHAFLCIMKKRLTMESSVDAAYSKEMYEKAYEHSINPVPGPKQWEVAPHTQPEPPPYKKMPGRPSLKKRRKEAGENEERRTVKRKKQQKMCGNCGQLGHNKKGCKNPTVVRTVTSRTQRKQVIQQNVAQKEARLTQGHPQGSQASTSSAM